MTSNPLLKKLDNDLLDYNRKVGEIVDDVASKQYYATIGIVVINILVFFALQFIPDDFAVKQINRDTISLLITLIMLMVSIPLASIWAKKILEKKRNEIITIPINLDYSGLWQYKTVFYIKEEKDSPEYTLVKNNMNKWKEKGEARWIFNAFELSIDFAATKDNTKKASVKWDSGRITFDEYRVSWSFKGEIKWKDGEDIVNKFVGSEEYKVTKHDEEGKPSYLDGTLTGDIHVGDKHFSVIAKSYFKRKEEETKASENKKPSTSV